MKPLYLIRWRAFDFRVLTTLVKAFTRRDDAERYREDLHRGRVPAPREANPFLLFAQWRAYGELDRTRVDEFAVLARLTSFPDEILCDWMLDCGLTPPQRRTRWCRNGPALTFRDWYDWWEEVAPHTDDYQRQKVWQALDRVTFFEIIETELET